jgi:hypothetical protein
MVVHISLGAACNVRYQISKFEDKESLFFDWLRIDFNSMCEIFENYNDIDKILNKNNIIYDENDRYAGLKEKRSKIFFKSLSYCESIHDLRRNYNDRDLEEFIEKYKRRFLRIINYIKNNEKIYFIRYEEDKIMSYDEKDRFINIIKKINENCDFYLIFIGNQDTKRENNYLELNKNNFKIKNKDIKDDWRTDFLDWVGIFNIIHNL